MRIGLISVLRADEEGAVRAFRSLAGRSVLEWQAALLAGLGVERVLCLADCGSARPELLEVQHRLEAGGIAFHALASLAAIAALVRAEDDLVVVLDGLLPDAGVVRAVLGVGEMEGRGIIGRTVATIPADHPLATGHPADFERIDASRHWAGVLAMRGAPVQKLADFPGDADAVSLLLRIALQAGTPCREMAARELVPECWLLADSAAALERHEQALIAAASAGARRHAPFAALAARLVRALAPGGLARGVPVAGAAALVLLLAGVVLAASGTAAAGLAAAGLGAFAAKVAAGFAALSARLRREGEGARTAQWFENGVDAAASLTLWFALAPWPVWQPLAVLGVVTVGLARLVARDASAFLAGPASDRAGLLLLLALATGLDLLPESLACLALGLLAALLLRRGRE